MNMRTKLPVSLLLLTAPLAAFAQPSSPHILSFIGGAAGGAVGGLLGALLALQPPQVEERFELEPQVAPSLAAKRGPDGRRVRFRAAISY